MKYLESLGEGSQVFLIFLFCVVLVLFIFWITGMFNNYTDTIYSTSRYRVTKTYMGGGKHEYDVEVIVIKRIYGSGKIKFLEKEVRV